MRLSTFSYNIPSLCRIFESPPIACSQSDVINSDSDCASKKDFFELSVDGKLLVLLFALMKWLQHLITKIYASLSGTYACITSEEMRYIDCWRSTPGWSHCVFSRQHFIPTETALNMKLDTYGTVKSAPRNLTFSFYLKCLEYLPEALVTMQVIKSSRTTEVSSNQEVAEFA